jgi:predicted permease
MDTFVADVRYAFRNLARAPGFTLTATLALALGTGATTAIFSVLDAVVLRPLPYQQADRLVTIWETNHGRGLDREPLSPVNFVDYRALSHVFEDAAAWWRPDVNLTDAQNEPVRAATVEASANLFAVLAVQPILGGGFPAAPQLHAPVQEVVISHRLWQSRYGGNRSIAGSTVQLNGEAFTVVGVMPAGFHFPGETDIWQRLRWDLGRHSRGAHFMEAVGRLREGVTIEHAQRELTALTARLEREFQGTNGGWSARAVLLQHEVAGFFRPALYVLLAAVGLLLLIACLNVANLLLARATVREREVAVRAAIGATRGRLVRQLLTESLVLAATGTLLGVLLALGCVTLLVAAAPIEIPRVEQVSIDLRVLGFATAVGLATSVVFGLMPALFLASTDLQRTLKDGGRGASGGPGGRRARAALVVAEVALALVLLVGAGLLIRSFGALLRERPGFEADRVLTVNLQLPQVDRASDWIGVGRFYADLVDAIQAHPAVAAAGAADFLPLSPGWRVPFLVRGRPPVERGSEPMAQIVSVTDDYFRTLGVPLTRGRGFTARDTPDAPGVVLINDTLARRHFPGEDPVGRVIWSGGAVIGPLGRSVMQSREFEIVGVVADVKNASLKAAPEPALLFSQRQFPFLNMHLVVRGRGDPAVLAEVVRAAVRRLDPTLPLSEVRTMDQVVSSTLDQPRFLMTLMSGFSALALVLAAIGVYGILAYAVGQRRQEISVRMALGAGPRHVTWLILRHGLGLTVAGAVAGTAGALALGRSLSSLLYGVTAADTTTFAGALLLVLGVGLLACLVPARRASGMDPLAGLRGE